MPRYVNPIATQAQAPQVSQPQAPRMQQQGYPAPAPAMGTSPYPTVSVGRVPHTAPFTPNYANIAPQPPVNFHHHAVHAPPPRAPKAQSKKPRSPPAAAPTPTSPGVPSSFLERAAVPSSGLGPVVGAAASAVPATRLQLTKKGKKDVVDQHAVSFAADAAVAYAQYPLESVAAARYEACITAHRLEREAVAARKAAANSTTEADAGIVADDDGEAEKPLVFVGQLPYSTPLEIIAFVIDVLASEDPAAFAADPSSALAAAPTSVVSIHRSGRNGARVTVTSHAVVDRLMARARTAYPDVHGLWVAQDQAPMMAHDARVEAKELKVDANVVARHPLNFERPRTSIPAADAATVATSAAVATSTPVEFTTPVTAEPIAPAAPTPRAVPAASASLTSVAPAGLGQKQSSIETVGSLASAPEPQPASLLPATVATPPSLPVFHAPLPMLAVTQPSGGYVLVPQAPHGAAPLWLSASGSASVSMSGPGSPLSLSNATGGPASTTASPYGASSPFIVPTAAVAAGQHLSGANNAQPQPQQPQLSQPMAAMTHGFAPAGHPALLQQPHQFANVAVGGVSVGAPAAVPTMAWQQGAPLPPPPPHSAVTAMTSESDVSSVRGPRGGADVSVVASRSSSTTASSDAAWDAFLERNGGAVRSDLFAHSRSTTTATSVDNGAALEFRTLTHDDITTAAADVASAENMEGEIKATKTAALLDPAAWSLSWQPRMSPSTNAATPSTTPASMSRVETSTW